MIFFFFQAEDGIRDRDVTGVQTCALPIYRGTAWMAQVTDPRKSSRHSNGMVRGGPVGCRDHFSRPGAADRKSTRLNSSHIKISYAVFCLKKKKEKKKSKEHKK